MQLPTLTADQLKFYQDNGFIVVYGLLTQSECDAYQVAARQYADTNFAAIMNLDRKDPKFRELMANPGIVSILEQLQGSEVVALMSQMLFKEAHSPYASQAWNPHQDNAYPQNPNGQYVTINIAFERQDKENGCLYIFPGSHKEGLYPCEETPSYRETPGTNPGNTVAAEVLNRFSVIDLPIEKGGVLFMHGNVVHGSYPNNSDRNRPLFSVSYITKGEKFIPGKNANRMEISLH